MDVLRFQEVNERIARLDIHQVGLLHCGKSVTHEILLHVWQGFMDLACDPLLPAIEKS